MPWLVVVRAILTLPDGWPARRLDRLEMQRLLLKGKLKGKLKAKVQLLAESGRRLDRQASGDRSGLSILGTAELRNLVLAPRAAPALILLKQDGGPTLGWKAGPFRWPMIASPPSAKPCVFATKVAA